MWTFNKFFSHFIFWKLLIRVLSAYIFFLLKNGKKTCSKITIFETLFANNNIHMSIISDCCFKTAMAYKRLRWLFCWPLIHCTCPVDKIKKKHLPELIQKYFWSWCIPYTFATFTITFRLNTSFHHWVICFELKYFCQLPNQIFELSITQALTNKKMSS